MRVAIRCAFLALAGTLAACELAVPPPQGAKPAAVTPAPAIADGMAALERGDHAAAAAVFRPLARAGNAPAQYQLAVLHADGKGVDKDLVASVHWLRQAAAQQHVDAQAVLGTLLLDDAASMAKTPREGLDWLRLAAGGGNTNAMALLSLLYRNDARFRDLAQSQYWEGKLADIEMTLVDEAAPAPALAPAPAPAPAPASTSAPATTAPSPSPLSPADFQQQVAALDDELARNRSRRQALNIERRDLLIEVRARMARQVALLAKFRALRAKAKAHLDWELQAEDHEHHGVSAQSQLQLINGNIAEMEAQAPEILGLRLLNGDVAIMGPEGRYVLLAGAPARLFDPAALPRPGDRKLPTRDESLLMEYETTWSGVEEDNPEARKTLAALNALLGEYTCDSDVFGYRLSTRNGAVPGSDLTLDSRGILRLSKRLGDSRRNAWSEVEEFAPLAQARQVEVGAGRDGECATVRLRCLHGRSCVLSMGAEPGSSAAFAMHFPRQESATEAADLLRVLLRTGAAGGAR